MSYCVNCGVELEASQRVCPLCETPVVNPAKPWSEPERRPYPQRVERIVSRADRRFGVALISLLLLVPVATTMLTNWFLQQRLSWSLLVAGGCGCMYVFALLPLLFAQPRPFLFLGFDTAAVLAYLAVIAGQSGDMGWYLPLAVPLALSAAAFVLGVMLISRPGRMVLLHRMSAVMAMLGALVVAVEASIKGYLGVRPQIQWSLFALSPCLALAAVFLILERQKKFKDEIKRRFFF